MEVTFTDLKEKEIVNVFDGKKLGRVVDIIFDNTNGAVKGIVVPGDKKLFRKGDDIFVPLGNIRRIGDDVILISLEARGNMMYYEGRTQKTSEKEIGNVYSEFAYNPPNKRTKQNLQANYGYWATKPSADQNSSFVRYRPVASEKYKR